MNQMNRPVRLLAAGLISLSLLGGSAHAASEFEDQCLKAREAAGALDAAAAQAAYQAAFLAALEAEDRLGASFALVKARQIARANGGWGSFAQLKAALPVSFDPLIEARLRYELAQAALRTGGPGELAAALAPEGLGFIQSFSV
ncbi:MAG: hypothetical protein ACYS22_18770, partial [Planctomycetota bacterium]